MTFLVSEAPSLNCPVWGDGPPSSNGETTERVLVVRAGELDPQQKEPSETRPGSRGRLDLPAKATLGGPGGQTPTGRKRILSFSKHFEDIFF